MMIANNGLEKTLIVYGSLAPNASNHHIVAHIKGQWLKGSVKGKLENMGWGADLGYLGFRHTSSDEAQEIKAHIFFSDELAENWAYLDDFEGDGYQRIVAQYELENGEMGIGYIYAVNFYHNIGHGVEASKISDNSFTDKSPFVFRSSIIVSFIFHFLSFYYQ